MRSIVSMTLAACTIAVLSSTAFAQTPAPAPATPPAPPSAGGTPDAMPFDIPYGVSIGLERAKQVMAAAEAEAKKRNWKMNIAVVDTNGEVVHFSRMEGAQIASGSISIGKARTSARFRRESRLFYNAFETGHGYVATLDPTLVASPGGFPARRRRQADRRGRLQRRHRRSGRGGVQGRRRGREITRRLLHRARQAPNFVGAAAGHRSRRLRLHLDIAGLGHFGPPRNVGSQNPRKIFRRVADQFDA